MSAEPSATLTLPGADLHLILQGLAQLAGRSGHEGDTDEAVEIVDLMRRIGEAANGPQETALQRMNRLLQEAMSAADEARAEPDVGEITADYLRLLADDNKSMLHQIYLDVHERLDRDEDAAAERARRYERELRADYYASVL